MTRQTEDQVAYQISLTLGDHADDYNIPNIACELRQRYPGLNNVDDIDSKVFWDVVRSWDMTEHRARQAQQPRFRELNKLRKGELCAMYRRMGHVWSLHPLEKWRKDEIIDGILEIERKRAKTAGPTA